MIWETQLWSQDWKVQKKGNAKECLKYSTIALVSHASRVMLKILQARIQQCVNQDVSLELSCFFDDQRDVGILISGSAFSKSSLNISKFMVHVLVNPGLENFEHYSASK